MTKLNDQIERVVGEVLARLEAAPAVRSDRSHSPSAGGAPGELHLDDQVISAGTLENRLSGVQRLLVPARAVLTPSARDLLKEKNVSLVRALSAVPPTGLELAVASLDDRFDSAGLIGALKRRHIPVQPIATTNTGQAIEAIARSILDPGKCAVLLTNRVATALCAANRHRGVRAASASNRGEVEAVVREIGANVLVIDTSRRGPFDVERMISAFLASPQRECPPSLKTILD